jgi:hypothetical protein
MFDFDFFDIEDWMVIGPMAEELSDEERERRKIEKDFDDEDLDQEDEDNF